MLSIIRVNIKQLKSLDNKLYLHMTIGNYFIYIPR